MASLKWGEIWQKIRCFFGFHKSGPFKTLGHKHPNGKMTLYHIRKCLWCDEIVHRERLGDLRSPRK